MAGTEAVCAISTRPNETKGRGGGGGEGVGADGCLSGGGGGEYRE